MAEPNWFYIWLAAGGLGMTFGEFMAKVRERHPKEEASDG